MRLVFIILLCLWPIPQPAAGLAGLSLHTTSISPQFSTNAILPVQQHYNTSQSFMLRSQPVSLATANSSVQLQLSNISYEHLGISQQLSKLLQAQSGNLNLSLIPLLSFSTGLTSNIHSTSFAYNIKLNGTETFLMNVSSLAFNTSASSRYYMAITLQFNTYVIHYFYDYDSQIATYFSNSTASLLIAGKHHNVHLDIAKLATASGALVPSTLQYLSIDTYSDSNYTASTSFAQFSLVTPCQQTWLTTDQNQYQVNTNTSLLLSGQSDWNISLPSYVAAQCQLLLSHTRTLATPFIIHYLDNQVLASTTLPASLYPSIIQFPSGMQVESSNTSTTMALSSVRTNGTAVLITCLMHLLVETLHEPVQQLQQLQLNGSWTAGVIYQQYNHTLLPLQQITTGLIGQIPGNWIPSPTILMAWDSSGNAICQHLSIMAYPSSLAMPTQYTISATNIFHLQFRLMNLTSGQVVVATESRLYRNHSLVFSVDSNGLNLPPNGLQENLSYTVNCSYPGLQVQVFLLQLTVTPITPDLQVNASRTAVDTVDLVVDLQGVSTWDLQVSYQVTGMGYNDSGILWQQHQHILVTGTFSTGTLTFQLNINIGSTVLHREVRLSEWHVSSLSTISSLSNTSRTDQLSDPSSTLLGWSTLSASILALVGIGYRITKAKRMKTYLSF